MIERFFRIECDICHVSVERKAFGLGNFKATRPNKERPLLHVCPDCQGEFKDSEFLDKDGK